MSTAPMRGRYQGVLQILQFNWRMYLMSAMGVAAAAIAWHFLPFTGRVVLLLGVVPAVFWLLASLLVSHYVYDRFPLYDFRWIAKLRTPAPRRWINIHSGWDETSGLLATVLPAEESRVVDLFDPRVMTENSIREAKQKSRSALPAVRGRYDRLPFADDAFDAAFAIFAAHELRRHEQRVDLFREIARILDSSGELMVMEHTRDWRNFLAFGPGFLHFFSRREWRDVAHEAGFTVETELKKTPFVQVFVMRKGL